MNRAEFVSSHLWNETLRSGARVLPAASDPCNPLAVRRLSESQLCYTVVSTFLQLLHCGDPILYLPSDTQQHEHAG